MWGYAPHAATTTTTSSSYYPNSGGGGYSTTSGASQSTDTELSYPYQQQPFSPASDSNSSFESTGSDNFSVEELGDNNRDVLGPNYTCLWRQLKSYKDSNDKRYFSIKSSFNQCWKQWLKIT